MTDRADPGARQASNAASVRLPFAAVVLAMLPAVLDQTILGTALPTIAADFGTLSDLSWVVTGYVVAAASATPLWGKLGDRRGRKALLEAALLSFLAASAVCGLARTMPMLVAARVAQGAAAGGLMTLAFAAVADLVPPRERARYQGYVAAVFAVATVAGPLAGGLLVEATSWRWVFYVNLPLGLVAAVGLRLRLPAGAPVADRAPLDLRGVAVLAGATTALMLACLWGGRRYPWGSPVVVSLLGTAAALAAVLVACERRAADPVVPLALLRSRTVAVAAAALFLATAALFAVNVFVPLLLQTTTGASPTLAGLLLVPMMLGISVSTYVAGRVIEATGRYRRFPVLGLGGMTVALVTLAVAAGHPSRAGTGVAVAGFGLGFGMVGQVLVVAVQDDVDRRHLGTAMATTTFFRGLGGAVGAAALGAVFAARSAGSPGTGGTGVPHLQGLARTEFLSAVQTVFWVAAPVAAAGMVVALLLRETPLPAAGEADAGTDVPPVEAGTGQGRPKYR